MVLVAFDVYLRPGEALDLLVKNLVPPVKAAGKQFKYYTLVIREEEDLVPAKTGVYNNSIPLDNPLTANWLGPCLMKLTKNKKQPPLPVRPGLLPRHFSEGRHLAGLARLARLPTSTWRRLRRSGKQTPRIPSCQGEGSVENGQFGQQDASMGSHLLPQVRSQNCGCYDGAFSAPQPVKPLWQQWTAAPPGSCLAIFAGSGRLTTALRESTI